MAETIIISEYQSPVGVLLLGAYREQLVLADWKYRKMRTVIDKRLNDALKVDFSIGENEVINKTEKQLSEYFQGKRTNFDLPLFFVGTEFQKRVWGQLTQIDYGKTVTYQQLSHSLRDENAIRAVASANGANAISIIVPCHRVIGKNGDLVGYAGGLPTKRKLLHLEQNLRQGNLFTNIA